MDARGRLSALAAICVLYNLNTGFSLGAGPGIETWQPNDSWVLEVTAADKTKFIVRVTAAQEKGSVGSAGWSLEFLPLSGAPPSLNGKRHRVILDKNTGYVQGAFCDFDKTTFTIDHAGITSFITTGPPDMPLEWINVKEVPQGKLEVGGTNRSIEIRKQQSDNTYSLEMIVTEDGVEQLSVRQAWGAGEKWWRTYERKIKGQTDLTARRLNIPSLNGQGSGARSQGQQAAASSALHQVPQRRSTIADDPQLNVKVKVIGSHPKIEDVLDTLSSAAGLKLMIDPALLKDPADLGEIRLNNAVCWSVMNYIAKKYPEGTHWEKTEDGYTLTATRNTGAEGSNPDPSQASFSGRWVLCSAIALMILGSIIITLGWLRNRRAKTSPIAAKTLQARKSTPTPTMPAVSGRR